MATSVTPISEARSFAARREGRSGRISVLLLLPVMVLMIIGLGALLSASSVLAIREGRLDNLYYFKRQAVFAGIGMVALDRRGQDPVSLLPTGGCADIRTRSHRSAGDHAIWDRSATMRVAGSRSVL